MSRECTSCHKILPWDYFHKNPSGKNGYREKCKSCVIVYAKNYRHKNNDKIFSKRYNISIEEYKQLRLEPVCAICGGVNKTKLLAIDHCHKTGKIRGVLCDMCNKGLGQFKDSKELLKKAIDYLND